MFLKKEGKKKQRVEAQAIDRWFEDLSNYEKTLEQMAEVKLLDSFKEEMRAVDSW